MAHLQWFPYEEADSDIDELDSKEYRRRIHPMEEFGRRKFRQRFRITKRQTEWLVDDFYNHVDHQGATQGAGLSIEDRFCVALRYLATGSNYSVVSDYQGVSRSTVSRSVRDISDYFYQNSYRYIHWPETYDEKLETALLFNADHGHPRIMGCIDGTHIAIRRPHINAGAFVNRKGFHSLNTTIVCDSNKLITHINPKWAGSVADAYAWNASSIRQESDNDMLDPFALLGDSGYGCRKNLFTPVRDPTTPAQQAYNTWHKRTRSIVECTIGHLKQRWRCLDHHGGYLYHTPQRACKIIIACAALHNIAEAGGVPIDVEDDHDRDAFRPRNNRRVQPNERVARDVNHERRDAYIISQF